MIIPIYHADHGLTAAQRAWAIAIAHKHTTFFIETVALPVHLPDLISDLHGPLMGDAPISEDEVHYAIRKGRKVLHASVNEHPAALDG